MFKDVPLRWVAEAEARSVQEFARVQREASEPPVSLAHTRSGPAWSGRVRRQVPRVARTLTGALSFPFKATMRARSRFSSAMRSSADPDFDRVLAAVLITDIVGSTKRAAEMGDRRWIALLDRHDDITRYQIREFGGRCIRNSGDGFLAIFASPARAIRCAMAIAEAMAPLGLSLRSGVHAGEIQLKRDKINGIAVHITARIAAAAYPDEVFVSNTVRDLVIGAEFAFEDRGVHGLRGLPEEIRLYSMRAPGHATERAADSTADEAGGASIVRLPERRFA
jgi:class 3 adenylate cyclase